jgi:hypothetical protein
MARSPLAELRQRVTARNAVVIVGLEVSHHATGSELFTWPGLLSDGFEHCREWGLKPGATDDGPGDDWEAAADVLARSLGEDAEDADAGPRWAKWLSPIDKLSVARYDGNRTGRQPASLIGAIWELGLPVATTNYDLLLERAVGCTSVTWQNPQVTHAVLTGEREDKIVHLHGVLEEGASIVLGSSRGTQLRHQDVITKALAGADFASCVVCMGFAEPRDPAFVNICKLLKTLSRWQIGHHFLLATDAGADAFRKSLLDEQIKRVEVIPYGESIAELEGFIRRQLHPSVPDPMRNAVGLDPIRRAVRVAGEIAAAHRPLGVHDAAVFLEQSLETCVRVLGNLNSPLRHLADRMHRPSDWDTWDLDDQEEFHDFYAPAAGLAAGRLEPIVDRLALEATDAAANAELYVVALSRSSRSQAPPAIRRLVAELLTVSQVAEATWSQAIRRLDELRDLSDRWRDTEASLPRPRERVRDALALVTQAVERLDLPRNGRPSD